MNREYPIQAWPRAIWPDMLHHIPDPPKQLRIRGTFPDTTYYRLCVVGPRKHTEYGEMVCTKIISGLAGYPISILSGLAFGIDTIAHTTAVSCGLHTIAFPGSGLADSVLYPRAHLSVAHNILHAGGCLISEYDDMFSATTWTFPRRNRLMVGMSHAVLIIEANHKSGTMITARLATDYNKDVLAVPGSIFSAQSEGPHALLRDGAQVITNAHDILLLAGFNPEQPVTHYELLSDDERNIYTYLTTPRSIDELVVKTNHTVQHILSIISALEIKEMVHIVHGKICKK